MRYVSAQFDAGRGPFCHDLVGMRGPGRRDLDPSAHPLFAFLHDRKIKRGVRLEIAGQVGLHENSS